MSDRSPERLRAEIEETREKLSEDLDELSYRFSPEGLKDRAQGTMESAQDVLSGATQGVADSLSERVESLNRSLLERIRANPLPATLLGAGAAWLLMQASRQGEEADASYDRAASYGRDSGGGTVQDGSGELVYRPPQETGGARNPLAVGVGVLVAGLAVGLLLPSRREGRRGAGRNRSRDVDRGFVTNAGTRDTGSTGRSARTTRVSTGSVQEVSGEAARESAYDFDADRDHYRTHHGDTYADTGFSYEDYEPAYRYGARLGGEEGYRGRSWDDALEGEVRSRWESEQRAPWDAFGGAVRQGFDRSRRR